MCLVEGAPKNWMPGRIRAQIAPGPAQRAQGLDAEGRDVLIAPRRHHYESTVGRARPEAIISPRTLGALTTRTAAWSTGDSAGRGPETKPG